MSLIARMFMRIVYVFYRYRQYFNCDATILLSLPRDFNVNNSHHNITIQFIYLANENIEINCKHCLLHAGLRKMHQVLRENSQRFSFNYISFGYSHVLRDIVVDNLGLLKRDHIRNHILEMFNIHDSAYK